MSAEEKAIDKSKRPDATVEEVAKAVKQSILKLSITHRLTPSKTIEALEQNIQELRQLQEKWAEEEATQRQSEKKNDSF